METSKLILERQNAKQKPLTVVVKHIGQEIKSVRLQGREIIHRLDIGYIQDLQSQIEVFYDDEDYDYEFTPSTF